jgi:hypothetical protein
VKRTAFQKCCLHFGLALQRLVVLGKAGGGDNAILIIFSKICVWPIRSLEIAHKATQETREHTLCASANEHAIQRLPWIGGSAKPLTDLYNNWSSIALRKFYPLYV